MELRVGQKIPLALQLFDGATDRHVRAWVRKPDGTQLSGSPYTLSHVASGLYENDNATMPDSDWVTAQYRVFDDSGFTSPSEDHADALDTFTRSTSIENGSEVAGFIDSGGEVLGLAQGSDAVTGIVGEAC